MRAHPRIVVGVDFSLESLQAVDHALEVARRTSAAVTLVHVGAVPDRPPDDQWAEVLRGRVGQARDRLDELHQRLHGMGVDVEHVVVNGWPDTALTDTAHELDARFVVVGTHGRTGLRRVALGSVAEKTARLAGCSVLITRGDAIPGGYRRIVVGTDYSPSDTRALAAALELAAPVATIEVVHVWHPPYVEFDLDGRMIAVLRDAAVQQAEQHRKEILATPHPPGVTIRFELEDGVPFAVLDGRDGTDLVVVSSHGRRGLRRLLLGSVAESTIRHARCSVLVAR